MATVIWLHSIYGKRDAIDDEVEWLKAAGHKVHAPDLYQEPGEPPGLHVFDNRAAATNHIVSLGRRDEVSGDEVSGDEVLRQRVKDKTKDVLIVGPAVWAGWSMGAGFADELGPERGATGLLLMSYVPAEPFDVPVEMVQIHVAVDDPDINPGDVKKAEREWGVTVERYRGPHIFADPGPFRDPGLPTHDPDEAERWKNKVLAFLAFLDRQNLK
jgi:dienelactone hydrolase